MNDHLIHLIQQAKRTLQGRSAGMESVRGAEPTGPQQVDSVYTRARARSGIDGQKSGVEDARQKLAHAYLEEGRKALVEVAAKGDAASLSYEGSVGLEAIVRLTGRPSFLVQHGTVSGVPGDSQWSEAITAAENLGKLGEVFSSIGRVNVPQLGGPGYVGTAFMVAPGIAMTNRHVAMTFAKAKGGGAWAIGNGFTPNVDFKCESGVQETAQFAVTAIELIHSDPNVDLALLRLAAASADGAYQLPGPLTLVGQATGVAPQRPVYVVGYPAFDPRNDASAIDSIFGHIFHVKRFAPGEVMALDTARRQFTHDSSTLGGNSGSCIVDFGTHRVSGLHFGGSFRIENRGVRLSEVKSDPELAAAGLNFG